MASATPPTSASTAKARSPAESCSHGGNAVFKRTAQILLHKFSANTSMIALSRSPTGGRRGKVSQALVQQPQYDILTTSNLEEDKLLSLIFIRPRPLVNDAAASRE
jgi:hypothetical protein